MGIPAKVIRGVLWIGPVSGASGAAGHYGSQITTLTETSTQQAIQIDELDTDYNNLQQQLNEVNSDLMEYGKEWDTRENDYRAAIRVLLAENSRWEERYKKEVEQRNLTEQRLKSAQELLSGMISSEQRKDMNHLEEKRKLIQLLMIKDSDLFQCVFGNSGNNGQNCGDQLKQLWQKNEKFVKKWLQENQWKKVRR